jgi:hypothetical protein
MYIPKTISLTKETVTLLEKQAKKMSLSHSALIRLLLLQNEKTIKQNWGLKHG